MEHSEAEPLSFRGLFHDLRDFRDSTIIVDALVAPWLKAQPEQTAWLREFGARTGDPIPPASHEDLWELYALSRVNETLLLRFQNGRADGTDYQGPRITLMDYCRIIELLGMKAVSHASFHPFFHEIVTVEQLADDDAPIELIGEYWPCVMLGPMMFSRAGVWVQGGEKQIRKNIAENSTIYWAYRRKNRPYSDQSKGWGHNSQWRTTFRRDYLLNGVCYFNIDANPPAHRPPDDDLADHEKLELLVHRCFIVTDKPHDDLFPYWTKYAMDLTQ